MKKKKVIAEIVLMFLGTAALLFGIFGKGSYDDLSALTDDSIGKSVTVLLEEPLPVNEDEGTFVFSFNEGDIEINAIIPRSQFSAFEPCRNGKSVPATAIIRRCTDQMQEEADRAFLVIAEQLAQMDNGLQFHDTQAMLREKLSPYYLEISEINGGVFAALKKTGFIAGCVLLFAAFIMLLSLLTKKAAWKVCLAVFTIVAVPVLIVGIIFFGKIRTFFSIRCDGDGVYYMEHKGDYKLDEMLEAGITSDSDLIEWIRKEELCNLPIDINLGNYGCAAFKAKTPDDSVLVGRNFDYPETDTLMVYSRPDNGYYSYSMVDLDAVGISYKDGKQSPDSLFGKIMMLMTPYAACDGLNEAGLCVSTLELTVGETHQNTGKPALFVYAAIRLLLDRCANVDEAVKMLECYDIHSHNNVTQHLFIADKSGRSVVVEWLDNKMYVNELDAATNSVLTPNEYYGNGADSRLPTILEELSKQNGILSQEQSRDLLQKVSQPQYTEWSCVYNLNCFAVDLYVDEDYTHAYHYSKT